MVSLSWPGAAPSMREGLAPGAPTHVMRLSTDERAARAVADLIGEVFDPGETAVAAFEGPDGRTWAVEAYFADEPDEAVLRELVAPVAGGAAVAFARLEPKDWVSASLEGLTPVRAGRFVVHGAHGRGSVRAHERGIEIEAALAFGTGHHGTTLGCLLALVDELKRRRPENVLDVGTGTGVLGLAAAKAGLPVVAGDLDPVAFATARENARHNGVAGRMRFYEGPGTRHALADRARGFDLVFANILAKPLRRLAPALARVVATGGTLVLSGLLPRDVPGVLQAYGHRGFRLARRREIEGWASLVLRRGGAAPRPLARRRAQP